MPIPVVQSGFDDTHTWQNANDRVAYERTFQEGTRSAQRIAIALMTADPYLPQETIREQMTAPLYTPPLAPSEPITINDIFNGGLDDPHVNDQPPTDYSGTNAGYTGSERGTMSWY